MIFEENVIFKDLNCVFFFHGCDKMHDGVTNLTSEWKNLAHGTGLNDLIVLYILAILILRVKLMS